MNSDLNNYKEVTALAIVTPRSEGEEVKEPTPVKEEVKESKPAAKGGKKGSVEQSQVPVVVDPNESKYFP